MSLDWLFHKLRPSLFAWIRLGLFRNILEQFEPENPYGTTLVLTVEFDTAPPLRNY